MEFWGLRRKKGVPSAPFYGTLRLNRIDLARIHIPPEGEKKWAFSIFC